ncbi:MAG: leucine--tRNA ligase, partial [Candidatus Kerfeldbacteria bacterium]|nr:leucine--tRNA ligase [Candidatus Kerfeldbacteria bacterium]
WFFKITDYADQLLNDLETIDWPEPIKLMQKNWIGKSEGAEIEFKVVSNQESVIRVYTTRPDTLYGVTYLVLSPEHTLVKSIVIPEQKKAVEDYVIATSKKNDLERMSEGKEKTGVFTGANAIHPLTGKEVPIWIADYVLGTYGTVAVMAVPAHDERDFEFATKYKDDLEIKRVIFSSQRYRMLDQKTSQSYVISKVSDIDSNDNEDDELPYLGAGILVDSEEFNDQHSEDAMWKIAEKAGGVKKVNYKMRDWLISRQRYWGAPIPIVYDPAGQAHPVKAEHLPLLLPTDVDYLPKGTSPIGTSKSYQALAEELYGKGWHFEVDTMDTLVCSSWYYLRYCDPKNATQFADPEKLAKWLPVDLYVGGAEHAVLHLLYARFFHKALQDFGFIPQVVGREPFAALRNQGMILGEDNQKMSKSRGNVINPDDVVKQYGSDTLRLYEMFIGPFADVKPWSTSSIKGVHRFLEKVERLQPKVGGAELDAETERLLHQTLKLVSEHIVGFQFNTAISQMMILTNRLHELETVPTTVFQQLLLVLSPFAPHLTAELWSLGGYSGNVWEQTWPKYDATKLQMDTVTIVVQVNGKRRGQLTVPNNSSEQVVLEQIQKDAKLQAQLGGQTIRKTVYVSNRLISFVL